MYRLQFKKCPSKSKDRFYDNLVYGAKLETCYIFVVL